MNKVEVSTDTEIQVDVELTAKSRMQCVNDFISALDLISEAEDDIKDYKKGREEEMKKYSTVISGIRYKIKNSSVPLADDTKTKYTNEMIDSMNSLSEIEDSIRSYTAMKRAEITQYEATLNLSRIKLNRGKEVSWVKVKMVKDFVAKTKTYFDLKTGGAVRTVPMTEDDFQTEMQV